MLTFEQFFFFFIFLILYTYFGYPALLIIYGKLKKRSIEKKTILPQIAIVTAARNEEQTIEDYIQNKLSLDYPKEKYNIIIVSDESDDNTDDIIMQYENEGIQYLCQSPRKGKTAALNLAIDKTNAEIIVFADANSMYNQDVLQKLVQNFYDPSVGYVTGRMVYLNKAGGQVGEGNSKYIQYENFLRKIETQANSLVGVDGGIDAIRRVLYKNMPADAQPDFYLPLTVIEQGYRVVYEKDAILKEYSLDTSKDEFKMRVRVSLRALRVLWVKKKLLNPFKYGFFSLQLLSHKVLRYLMGIFQIIIFTLNLMIMNENIFFMLLFLGQIAFYLLSIISLFLEKLNYKNNPFSMFYYFNLLNLSALIAFIKLFSGAKQTLWEPRKG